MNIQTLLQFWVDSVYILQQNQSDCKLLLGGTVKENLFEGNMPTKITFDDDSFDMTTIEFQQSGKFSIDSLKAINEKRFRASVLDSAGKLREFRCEVEKIEASHVTGRWEELDE